MTIKDSYSEIFQDVERVLVVMAHPDDAEVICGGLMARLASDNKTVRLVVSTNGGKGYQDRSDVTESEFAKLRFTEQVNAGLKLGVNENQNFNLDYPDGEMPSDLDAISKLTYHIRNFKPDLVITHNPNAYICSLNEEESFNWINHRDHRNTAIITLDAVYPYSRDKGFFKDQEVDNINQDNAVRKILVSDSFTDPKALYFGIEDFLVNKADALREHKNAINPDYIEDYIAETEKPDGKHYEVLRYFKIH